MSEKEVILIQQEDTTKSVEDLPKQQMNSDVPPTQEHQSETTQNQSYQQDKQPNKGYNKKTGKKCYPVKGKKEPSKEEVKQPEEDQEIPKKVSVCAHGKNCKFYPHCKYYHPPGTIPDKTPFVEGNPQEKKHQENPKEKLQKKVEQSPTEPSKEKDDETPKKKLSVCAHGKNCKFYPHCKYYHPPGTIPDKKVPVEQLAEEPPKVEEAPTKKLSVCISGKNCKYYPKCKFEHPPGTIPDCRFGNQCTRPDCAFNHPNGYVPGKAFVQKTNIVDIEPRNREVLIQSIEPEPIQSIEPEPIQRFNPMFTTRNKQDQFLSINPETSPNIPFVNTTMNRLAPIQRYEQVPIQRCEHTFASDVNPINHPAKTCMPTTFTDQYTNVQLYPKQEHPQLNYCSILEQIINESRFSILFKYYYIQINPEIVQNDTRQTVNILIDSLKSFAHYIMYIQMDVIKEHLTIRKEEQKNEIFDVLIDAINNSIIPRYNEVNDTTYIVEPILTFNLFVNRFTAFIDEYDEFIDKYNNTQINGVKLDETRQLTSHDFINRIFKR